MEPNSETNLLDDKAYKRTTFDMYDNLLHPFFVVLDITRIDNSIISVAGHCAVIL